VKNAAEASETLATIGELRREITRLETSMNDEIAGVRSRYEERVEPVKRELAKHEAALEAWCNDHRDELTDNCRRKFWDCPSGRIGWRTRPPAVRIRNVKKVLAALRDSGLSRFIRVKEEIDKEAMLQEPLAAQKVPGVKFEVGCEDFYAEPHEDALAQW
jgi:phage host-nuclease inhibitor protein Gam